MINTLNFGKYIQSSLAPIVANKVYPIVVRNGITAPFIVYKRVALNDENSKDGYIEDRVSMEMVIVAPTYAQSIELATKVREKLEKQNVRFEGYDINDASITLATEEYSDEENMFVQRLQMSFTINN